MNLRRQRHHRTKLFVLTLMGSNLKIILFLETAVALTRLWACGKENATSRNSLTTGMAETPIETLRKRKFLTHYMEHGIREAARQMHQELPGTLTFGADGNATFSSSESRRPNKLDTNFIFVK